MPIIVSPHNKRDEKILLAFLSSHQYEFSEEEKDIQLPEPKGLKRQTLEEYNEEIKQAVSEVESGDFIAHKDALRKMESWRKK